MTPAERVASEIALGGNHGDCQKPNAQSRIPRQIFRLHQAPQSIWSSVHHLGRDALSLNANAAFKPELKFTAGTTPHSFFRTGFNGLVGSGVSKASAGPPRNARALRGNRIEYGFDLLSILKMRRGNNLGARSGPSLSNRFGYLMVTNSN